ncbi:MAG: SDR family NAD(P)-dependent oxidoreductase [Acutalibacteraceae bacterium]
MKIAVITGASSGLGREYAAEVARERENIDEIWLIARREDKLKETARDIKKPVRILPLDITDNGALNRYAELLNEQRPEVALLINNAGFGRLGDFDKITAEANGGMVRLNCEALTVMTLITLPFMSSGGEIINTCSIAAFAPNTRMAVYCSTKAYVLSLSKALRSELKGRKINVLAVCPGPMDTEFLPVAGIAKGSSRTFDTLPRVKPDVMAKKSLAASAKKRGIYTNLLFYKFYRVIAKIFPHSIVMKMCGA